MPDDASDPTDPADLLAVADELYGLPLAEFTPARDAHAKRLKGDDAALAAQVKALRKPALAAWVVDLLARRDVEQVQQVLAVGAALREAQASMSATELRELTRQRRQLTAAVTQRARALASDAGVRVTPAVADQVEATLTAAMVDERCAQAVRSGLLVTPLAATGVDEVDVAAAVATPEALGFAPTAREEPVPAPPTLRVVPDPDAAEKARAAAQEAVEEATEARDVARADHEEAAQHVQQLEARELQLQAEIDEVRRRLAQLESDAEEVEDDLGDAEEAQASAAEALEEAETALGEAQAALDRLAD